MHHRALRAFVIEQDPRFAQAGAQRHGELAAKLRQLFRFVGVRHLDAQLAALLDHAGQHADNRRNAIVRRQIFQQLADHQHLAGKNQRIERKIAHQAIGLFVLITFEQYVAAVLFNPRETIDFTLGGSGGDFRRALFFKTGTAIE